MERIIGNLISGFGAKVLGAVLAYYVASTAWTYVSGVFSAANQAMGG